MHTICISFAEPGGKADALPGLQRRWRPPILGTFSRRLALVTECVTIVGRVIRSWKSAEAEKIWHGDVSRKLPRDIQQVARRKLRMLNNAQTLSDLRIPPSNHLEALKQDRIGQHSIRVNDEWRVCFEWKSGHAENVEIVDYH